MQGNGDRWTRAGIALAVLLVAGIAAVISYQHLYALAYSHGEPQLDAALIPLSIDGTVITASLLMLAAARAGRRTPWLARLMLVAAVAMTVAANVAFGWAFAVWGILMAGWPAAAFLANAEATIMAGRKPKEPAAEPVPLGVLDRVPSDVVSAARASMAATVAAGNPLSQNQLQKQFGLTRAQASEVRAPYTPAGAEPPSAAPPATPVPAGAMLNGSAHG